MKFNDVSIELYDAVIELGYPWSMRGPRSDGNTVGSLPRAGLGRLRVAMNVTFAQASREVGLSEQQAELLCATLAPARSIGDLARVLHCDQSNVSRLVDRASKRGLLERRRAQLDGRLTVVELTPDGRRLALRFIDTLESKLKPLLTEWSTDRQQQAVETLTEIAETLEASHAIAAPEPTQPERPIGAWVVGAQ
jgi:DNA-binding MarR family transcriptional regulator